jgi:hypothetical protein
MLFSRDMRSGNKGCYGNPVASRMYARAWKPRGSDMKETISILRQLGIGKDQVALSALLHLEIGCTL